VFYTGPAPASACPIPGGDFRHGAAEDGKVVLEVDRSVHGWAPEPDRTYILIDGKYVWVNPTEVHKKGLKAFREKRYGEAAKLFQDAVRLDPENAEYINDFGFACFKIGIEAENAHPDSPSLYEADLRQAVTLLERTIAIDPKRAIAYLNLGDAYASLKRDADARQAYMKFLELAPNSRSAADVRKKLQALSPTH
jgi:Flp pilus assembly protein TadD